MANFAIWFTGYEPKELIGRPSLELVHPDEFPRTRQIHYDTITQDKAAVLVYLRMRHKDPYKGYVLCGVSRTVVHNVLVGSVSFASPGAKAMHNASTAQEITVIAKGAHDFEFRRWHDPSPLPNSPTLAPLRNLPPSPSSSNGSAWSSPSPPPISLPPLSSSTSTGRYGEREYSNTRAEPFYVERSPSPITGRPRVRRQSGSTLTVSTLRTTPASPARGHQSPPLRSPPRSPSYRLREHGRDRDSRHTSPVRSKSRSPSPGLPTPTSEVDPSSVRRTESGSQSYGGTSPVSNGSHHGSYHHREDHHHRELHSRDGYGRHQGRREYTPPPPPRRASPIPRPSTPVITFPHLPSRSFRTAFILDRFTVRCTILYCSNDLLVQSTHAIGRSFFDFVCAKDEGIVKTWIECVKGWGVNERGQPSDGGFGFGRFGLLVAGRESMPRLPEPKTPSGGSRHRQGSSAGRHHNTSRTNRHRHDHRSERERERESAYAEYQREVGEQFAVDAIFSAHSDGLMVILRRAEDA
ncbi:hypothetical protein BKA70DRAFT_857528 [Coprinopsis sp. MPI-PUGE-AT-0042]|nr:hypothetical protein BKA70DRAFT_857528 [Coprinopsis sp. MPI-PUGE-AT-0042]